MYVYVYIYINFYVCEYVCIYVTMKVILTGYFAKCPIKLGKVNNDRFFIKSPGSFT